MMVAWTVAFGWIALLAVIIGILACEMIRSGEQKANEARPGPDHAVFVDEELERDLQQLAVPAQR